MVKGEGLQPLQIHLTHTHTHTTPHQPPPRSVRLESVSLSVWFVGLFVHLFTTFHHNTVFADDQPTTNGGRKVKDLLSRFRIYTG